MPNKILGGVAGKAAVLAILVCVGVLVAGSAGASAKHGPTTTTIKIKQKPSGKPYFDVPSDGVDPLSNLKVVNKTNPKQIGPHTFSLVTPSSVPKGPAEKKACGKLKDGTICQAIAGWHEVSFGGPGGFSVGKKTVEAGNPGWDTEGDTSNEGDSQFFLKKDQGFSRQVTASPGTLHFVCAVHPEMHGKIDVLPLR